MKKMTEIITLKEILELYDEMQGRPCGDGWFTKYDGTEIDIDTGYAFEGIELFLEEIKHKIESRKQYEKNKSRK